MPQAASIAIADNTPTTRNYNPVNVSGLTARHADVTTAATPAGQSYFTLELRPATSTVARKVNIDFALPVEYTDSTTGNILTKDVFRFKGEWILPPNSTATMRGHFEALIRNLISHATVKGYIKDGDPEY
jgi:hypothetical protein